MPETFHEPTQKARLPVEKTVDPFWNSERISQIENAPGLGHF